MSGLLPRVRSGTWYHLAQRALENGPLLPTRTHRDAFVSALGRIAHAFAVEFHAYCAMETHYHVLARGDEVELRRAFARLHGDCGLATEDARFRRMVFGRHLLHVTRYIHLNPVEARLVAEPGDWPWSSYPAYVGRARTPPWLRTAAVLGCLGSIGCRHLYRRYVEGPAA